MTPTRRPTKTRRCDHTIHLKVSHEPQDRVILDKLDHVLTLLAALRAQEISMDATTQASLDNLNVKVAVMTDVVAAVETTLQGMAAQIAALKNGVTDPAVIAALDAATAIVATDTARVAAAIVANTDAA